MAESVDDGAPEPTGPRCNDPAGMIAALRERGAHAFDPIGFRFIDALARRASAHEGDARRLLDDRLARLLSGYEERFEAARVEAGNLLDGVAQRFPEAADELRRFYLGGNFRGLRRQAADLEGASRGGPLAELVRHIARHPSVEEGGGTARDAVAEGASSAELKTLRYFRSTWSKLSLDQRLHQSLAKVPENAGPLNSHALALRSLRLMRDISPAYLNRFMSYLDALAWLDQANEGAAPVPREVARGDGDRDRKPKAGRKRSG